MNNTDPIVFRRLRTWVGVIQDKNAYVPSHIDEYHVRFKISSNSPLKSLDDIPDDMIANAGSI